MTTTHARTAAIPHLVAHEVGDGPTRVAFLHGLMGRGRNFQTVARSLGDGFTSLLVDLPNHGESMWTADWDYPGQADAVARQLRRGFAADGPVDLVGHSMGGKVAMLVALRHPDLVRRLVVLDMSPTSTAHVGEDFGHLLGSLHTLDLDALVDRNDADRRLAARIPDPRVRGFLLQNLRRKPKGETGWEWQPHTRLLEDFLPEMSDFPDTGDAVFEGPVLWLGGDRSNYIRDEDAPRMRELFPNVRRMTVKNAGHWVHADQPEVVVAALRHFLR